jgi:hypothetical protein
VTRREFHEPVSGAADEPVVDSRVAHIPDHQKVEFAALYELDNGWHRVPRYHVGLNTDAILFALGNSLGNHSLEKTTTKAACKKAGKVWDYRTKTCQSAYY